MRIAFVGLGAMGLPIAERLAETGVAELSLFDQQEDRRALARGLGSVTETLAAAVDGSIPVDDVNVRMRGGRGEDCIVDVVRDLGDRRSVTDQRADRRDDRATLRSEQRDHRPESGTPIGMRLGLKRVRSTPFGTTWSRGPSQSPFFNATRASAGVTATWAPANFPAVRRSQSRRGAKSADGAWASSVMG